MMVLRRFPRNFLLAVVVSVVSVILLLVICQLYSMHMARRSLQDIIGTRSNQIPEPSGMELYDLSPMPFAAMEHILPDTVKHKYAIINVVDSSNNPAFYQHAMLSVACYARAQGYEFRIFISTDFAKQCPHKDVYLQRHCVVAHILPNYHTILYTDADMGVVNPKRRFEDYIDNGTEIAFFDRFYNWEIAAGSYIVRNTNWSQQFLKGFADYEYRLPTEYHGTDNGALHAYIAEILFSDTRRSELEFCLRIYYNLKSYKDLFTFEACIRQMIGMHTKIGNIQIYKKDKGRRYSMPFGMRHAFYFHEMSRRRGECVFGLYNDMRWPADEKGTAWVRDNWMTNSKWSPDRDFMLHNWKIHQLRRYRQSDLPLTLHGASKAEWFNPFKGIIQLELCTLGNTTWSYDENLIDTQERIDAQLRMVYDPIDRDRLKSLARASLFL